MLISLVLTLMKDFYEYSPYECRLDAQYKRLNMKIIYLEEMYQLVYKIFLSAMEHLDYQPRMNSTK